MQRAVRNPHRADVSRSAPFGFVPMGVVSQSAEERKTLNAARARAEGRCLRSATSETVRPRLERVESHAVKNTLLRVIRYVKKSLEE